MTTLKVYLCKINLNLNTVVSSEKVDSISILHGDSSKDLSFIWIAAFSGDGDCYE